MNDEKKEKLKGLLIKGAEKIIDTVKKNEKENELEKPAQQGNQRDLEQEKIDDDNRKQISDGKGEKPKDIDVKEGEVIVEILKEKEQEKEPREPLILSILGIILCAIILVSFGRLLGLFSVSLLKLGIAFIVIVSVYSVLERNHENKVIKWLKKAAEDGNAVAQFRLGMRYAKGKGVVQDVNESLKWFRKAAEQGNKEAKKKLGNIL